MGRQMHGYTVVHYVGESLCIGVGVREKTRWGMSVCLTQAGCCSCVYVQSGCNIGVGAVEELVDLCTYSLRINSESTVAKICFVLLSCWRALLILVGYEPATG